MSKSSLFAMSYLITNLGCEMIYVLCSRLKAQNVPEDKASKVINDVVCSLFDQKFINQINAAQDIGKHSAIKQLFEKLAHSSIMKLNSNSMSKLFDLMLMSLKLQFLRSRYPEEMAQIAYNHLVNVIDILKAQDEAFNREAIKYVSNQAAFFQSKFNCFNAWDFVILRQTILRFFQGKNIKVSIFIAENMQSDSGVIYLPIVENAPPLMSKPGSLIDLSSGTEKLGFIALHLSNTFNSGVRVIITLGRKISKRILHEPG